MLTLLLGLSVAMAAEPLKVAVIDTGLDFQDPRFSFHLCVDGHLDLVNSKRPYADTDGHGTHVTGLIVQHAKNADYCLMIIKYYDENSAPKVNYDRFEKSLSHAVQHKADIISYSGGGPGFNEAEYITIRTNHKTVFIVAAGNEGQELGEGKALYYPACYGLPNIVTVGALDRRGVERWKDSNYGPLISAWQIGEDVDSTYLHGKRKKLSGTSMAAAIHTGKVIYERTRCRSGCPIRK